ncbi:thioesterase family protein [Leucobacter sp. NPDC015123]|uniref:thioesterase family protein n=1 Tax=Leucobacter sp. NPDC015123 TaxID=3364129 RepID=UPI0036F4830F
MTASHTAYFRQHSPTRFEATQATAGAWNTAEQHIAPVIGLLAHLIEQDHGCRGGSLRLASLSCDILGVLPIGEFDVEVTVIRPGRTIELVEAVLTSNGRTGVRARAWMLQTADTSAIEGTSFPAMPTVESIPAFPFGETWNGECVKTVEARREYVGPGRARSWVRTSTPLIDGVETSTQARMIGMLDFANGMVPRADPSEVGFPNVDLNVSLFRVPSGSWLGLDSTVSFGADAIGQTESVVHDEHGPVGTLTQTLTIRL